MESLSKLIGLSLFDITRMSFSQLDEWYIIKMCKEYDEIILNKPGFNQASERMIIAAYNLSFTISRSCSNLSYPDSVLKCPAPLTRITSVPRFFASSSAFSRGT